MLIWFIPVAVFVVLIVISYLEFGINAGDIGVALIVSFVSLLISFLICVGVCACSPTQTVEADPEVMPIYAMNDNYNYLRRGESKYMYLAFEEGKGLTTKEADIAHSYINYITDEAPYVEIHEREVRNPVIRFLFQFNGVFDYEYYFYLPETANVTDDFIIDLE